MRKIFRMALVFALAGATLMYTGCTKDYSEEINGLGSDVASLNTNLQALQQDLSTLKSSVSALESAYKAADTALQKAIDANSSSITTSSADIAALKAAVDALKIQIDADETKIAAAEDAIKKLEAAAATHATKDDLNSAVKDLQDDIAELKGQIEKQGEDFTAALDGVKADLDAAKAIIALNEAAIKTNGEAIIKNAEDIKANAEAIALAQAAIEAAEERIADAEADINANAEAIKANKIAAEKALEDALALIVENRNDIDANAKQIEDALKSIGNIETDIDTIKTDIEQNAQDIQDIKNTFATIEALNGVIADLGQANEALNDFKKEIKNELRSLVFVPEFYYAGIEAAEYPYAYVTPMTYINEPDERTIKKDVVNVPGHYELSPDWWNWWGRNWWEPMWTWVDDTFKKEDTLFKVLKGEPTAIKQKLNAKGQSYWYSNGALAHVKYYLNPSTFNTENADWSLLKNDSRFVTKAEAENTWNPTLFGSSPVVNEEGYAKVTYKVEKPELAASPYFRTLAEKWDNEPVNSLKTIQSNLEDLIPVMSLIGDLDEDTPRTISSDWNALIFSPEFFTELAFVKDTKKTDNKCKLGGDDLYLTADEAILSSPSVAVPYNGGAFDLAPYIAVHMEDGANSGYETTLEELTDKYPDLRLKYQLIKYTIGKDYKTRQDAYGRMNGSKFIPQYVAENGTSVDCTSNSGESAVGKFPVVLVSLWDGDELVLAGYFKIEIVKEISTTKINFPTFDPKPYICGDNEYETTWEQFSSRILEKLNTNYAEFTDPTSGYKLERYESGNAEIYIERDGMMTNDLNVYNAAGAKTGELYYGDIKYTMERDGTGINDAFTWTINKKAADCIGAGKSQTVYVKFTKGEYITVYVGFTAQIAAPATFDFSANKIANEWYGDIKGEAYNTVRINVPVPESDADVADYKVLEFERNLFNFYVGQTPAVLAAGSNNDIYRDNKGESTVRTESSFKFSVDQPSIDGVQLYTNRYFTYNNESGNIVYVAYKVGGKYQYTTVTVNGQQIEVPAIDKDNESNIIAEIKKIIDNNGKTVYKIVYRNNTTAKALLNKWAYTETDDAKMLYANVTVRGEYGKTTDTDPKYCISAGSDNFHVRFVRPLDIKFVSQEISEESAVTGFNIELAKFIGGITDWNHQEVITDELAWSLGENGWGMYPTGRMTENVINNVNMYDYYKISSMKVDLDNAMRDNWQIGNPNAKKKLTEVTPDALLAIDGNMGTKTIIITDFADLYKPENILTYKNNRAVVETFNIYIPVEIEYAWGTLKTTVELNVKPTSETSGR